MGFQTTILSWAVCGNAETKENLVTSIFLDFDQLEDFNYRIQEKYAEMEANEVDFEEYQMEDAEIILVAYGISSRIARSAVELARSQGMKVGLFRPKTLFPFPKDELKKIADERECTFISVEMSNGQMADDIRLAVRCKRPVELVNRMGGNLMNYNLRKDPKFKKLAYYGIIPISMDFLLIIFYILNTNLSAPIFEWFTGISYAFWILLLAYYSSDRVP